jgi:hypothetical protein
MASEIKKIKLCFLDPFCIQSVTFCKHSKIRFMICPFPVEKSLICFKSSKFEFLIPGLEKQYTCGECGKEFDSTVMLKFHISTMHDSIKEFKVHLIKTYILVDKNIE